MDKNKINISDDQFRELLSVTREKASENLKFRIIQQIETEKVLTGKEVRNSDSIFGNILPILGVMYSLIALVVGWVYFNHSEGDLFSPSVLTAIVAIAAICNIFLLISAFDDKRRNKHKS